MRSVAGLTHASQFVRDFHTRETGGCGLSDSDLRAAAVARSGREALAQGRRLLSALEKHTAEPLLFEQAQAVRGDLVNVKKLEHEINAVHAKFQFKNRLIKALDFADDKLRKIPHGQIFSDLTAARCSAERQFWNANEARQAVAAVELLEKKFPDFRNGLMDHEELVARFREMSLMQKEDKSDESKPREFPKPSRKPSKMPINRDLSRVEEVRRIFQMKRVEKTMMAPVPVETKTSQCHTDLEISSHRKIVPADLVRLLWWINFTKFALFFSGTCLIFLNFKFPVSLDVPVQFLSRFISMALGGMSFRFYLAWRKKLP